MKILVILAPGFEETEAITVIDVLRRAKLEVITASLTSNQTVLGSHHIPIIADLSLDDACKNKNTENNFEALVLPGGMRGVENLIDDTRILPLVNAFYNNNKFIAAVCAAPLILDKAGILDGHNFTCHPCIFDRIRENGRVLVPAISDRTIVTGRSAGCALPWAIELTKTLTGNTDAVLSGLAIL